MAEVAWFDNLLGGLAPPRATDPPVTALDRARFRRHRTIFISDTHLGTRGCKAEALADFLAHNDCATLFLVGDIVDGWQLKRRWYWSEAQSQVVAEILRKVDGGTRVILVPGNHDEFARAIMRGGFSPAWRSSWRRSTRPPTARSYGCCMAIVSTA